MNKNTTPAPDNGALLIESLDQLQALVDAPLYVDFKLDGQNVRVACKRLSQAVDEQVRALRREAQPVYVPAQKDYDYTGKDYLAKRDLNEKIARNLIVYCGCPAVAAKNPGLTDKRQIYDYVRGLLTEQILELIALTVQAGGMELAESGKFYLHRRLGKLRGWEPAKRPDEPELPAFDQEFLELRTAKDWGLSPREWRAQSEDDRALMMAYDLFCSTREGYRVEEKERMDKKKEKGINPYEAMKRYQGL